MSGRILPTKNKVLVWFHPVHNQKSQYNSMSQIIGTYSLLLESNQGNQKSDKQALCFLLISNRLYLSTAGLVIGLQLSAIFYPISAATGTSKSRDQRPSLRHKIQVIAPLNVCVKSQFGLLLVDIFLYLQNIY